MQFANYARGYVLKLEPGEELRETLSAFMQQKRLPSAFFQGIGSLCDVELGYFSLSKGDYEKHFFEGNYELISASGNISIEENDHPFVHCHAILSNEKCQTIAGHLFKGIVTVTAEIFLFPVDMVLIRKKDKKLNYKGLDLPHHFVR